VSAQIEQTFETPVGKYLVDPYENWARGEDIPIHTGAALDLLTLETRPWARFGVKGALCHLDGRCDFLTVFLMEVAPGAVSAPQQHLYEEVCYVLSGTGETEIEFADGSRHTLQWGPGSLFSPPMNARYRHRCTSGTPARFAAANDLRYLMNLYRNEQFLFETPLGFPERGHGEVVADLSRMPVGASDRPHESTAVLTLADGSIGADIIELAPGTYGQARRQMFGSVLFGVQGEGMTVSWVEGPEERSRLEWRHGMIFSLPGLTFHQHFNNGAQAARLLRVEFGSQAYPILRPRKRAYGDTSVYASGNAEIRYADESPDLRRDWLGILAKAGVKSAM